MEINTDSLNFLLGKRLDQICLGLYVIQLNFAFNDIPEQVDCSISIFHRAHLEKEKRLEEVWMHENGKKPFPISILLNETIEQIEIDVSKKLSLWFSNDFILQIYADDDDSGESYLITFQKDFLAI